MLRLISFPFYYEKALFSRAAPQNGRARPVFAKKVLSDFDKMIDTL
jgi:hypothetical protein